MAECTGLDLRKARDAQKMPRWQLGQMIGVSEDTIRRWEIDEIRPEPDDVGAIEQALGLKDLWHRWMLSHYDSYRERYSQAPAYGLTSAVIRTRYELNDVMTLQERVERDAVDGRLDDPALKTEYIQQLKEAQAAIIQTLEELK